MSRRSPLSALRRDRTVQAVVVLAALALVARLAFLGTRVAHQDEARVGYWTLRYAVSGVHEYRSIVHGPFIPIVNARLFSVFGASDFVARLPMAILGALAPVSALLYRGRLRDSETVAFGALLAANPVLLYYSRFMRQDVPLAVFVLFALGFAIRAIDAEAFHARRRYVLAAVFAFAMACTTKENVLLYPAAWIGAAALVWDQRAIRRAAAGEDSTLSWVWDWVGRVGFWRVAGAVALLVANPGTLTILGVPSGDEVVAVSLGFLGVASPKSVGFALLVVAGAVGYLKALDSPNPLHYLGILPLGFLAGLVAVNTVGIVFLESTLSEFGSGIVFGSLGYVYERFLAYYSVSWLLAVALLFDRAVLSRGLIRRGSPRPVATDGGGPDRDSDPDPHPHREASTDTDADTGSKTVDPDSGSDGETPGASGEFDDAGSDSRVDGEAPGARRSDGAERERGGGLASRVRERGRYWFVPPALAAYAVFFAVVIFFYAPRGGGYPEPAGSAGGVGLYSALGSLDFTELNYVVWEATVGTWLEFLSNWGGEQAEHAYIPYFTDFAETMYAGALTLSVAAGVGILLDRYGEGGPRDFVSFCTYWGIASVLGYPLVTDIAAPWVTVHAIVPLAVPAAVALAFVARWGGKALTADDRLGVAIALLILLGAVGQVGLAAAEGVYFQSQSEDNHLVQYAQSSTPDLKRALGDVREIARRNEGTDLLYFGNELDVNEESYNDLPFAGDGWFDRLPIAWYTESWDYNWRDDPADVVVNSSIWTTRVNATDAPVVVALGDQQSGKVLCQADRIDQYLDGYRKYCGKRYLYDSGTVATVVVFVEEEWLERIPDPANVYERTGYDVGNATG